jgi:hypothetical protein
VQFFRQRRAKDVRHARCLTTLQAALKPIRALPMNMGIASSDSLAAQFY